MRNMAAVIFVSASALIAAGVLGVAGAETTTSPAAPGAPQRTVSVQGVASEPLDSTASAASATAVYRQGMADAIVDGQAKAQFLAEKAGATLGPVQSIGEGGGYISCPEEVEYQGVQPDFGFAGTQVIAGANAPAATARPTPALHRPASKRHSKRRTAKKAATETCTLSTQVALVYQLS